MRYSLSVRGRRLLRELRAIRESCGLSPEQVAKRLGWSRSKIYRVENGESRLILEDLELLLNVYGVPSPQAEALGKLCREAWKRGWWLAYSDMYKGGSYFVLEDDASVITFVVHNIPGLLQTPDYAHALIAATLLDGSEQEIRRRVEARITRHRLLTRAEPPQITAILDEAILWRQIGGTQIARTQLDHLIDVAAHPAVTLQIIPLAAGGHPGLDGEFTILDFPDKEDPPVAYQEGFCGDIFVEAPDDVARYYRAAETARGKALAPDESVTLIKDVRKAIQ
ncbi:helix-turn-helix domain-containing protein [Streptosporangium sp. NBC_01755]|uniref:helix-turn-helix domain-containing protein n=1 Tax=unclassified Streptosporangium TaxID=2632669 RepID=UPI002DD89162|nr:MULTISPECIES: helix-turn-helix transcriptional regulator [unclassified Streptosporangium]WSA28824.1 helix-turn-helix domain-containing protein [Streptosporangium sp. NBC_01810]WSC99729.1 helix-turn-helix domain-containing protein [Streptosporangium sp. NBC_01755]